MLAEEGEAPKALLDRPELELHLEPFWSAFHELSTDRPIGGFGGAGPIPFTSIDRFASRFGFDDPDEFERLRRMLRAMDGAYLAQSVSRPKAGEGRRG